MASQLQLALSRRIVMNALKIALIAGTVLTVIHQREAILANVRIAWIRVHLNYLAPYPVAGYGAAENQMISQDGE